MIVIYLRFPCGERKLCRKVKMCQHIIIHNKYNSLTLTLALTLRLTFLFSEKKVEYNTVQLYEYKEEYIYACMMNNIYIQKSIFDMKINLNNNYECNKN